MKVLTFLLGVLIFVGCKNGDSINAEKQIKYDYSKDKFTIKYKHLLTINSGSVDSLRSESHYLYIGGVSEEQKNMHPYFYTLLCQLCYCYLDTTQSRFPVNSISFYDSMEGFPASKNIDDIGNINPPFFAVGFDRKNPISLPLNISFFGDGNNKVVDMKAAFENFHNRGCQDAWAGGVSKFAPLEN